MLDIRANDRLLITVHGIRTFGSWQDKLGEKVRDKLEAVEVCHYRYGFFTILAFVIPPFRWLATRRFRSELLRLSNSKKWSRIDIVAHSFGTHLVGWSLLSLSEAQRPTVHTVIFAGSVLRSSFPIRSLVGGCVARLVNDCGINDRVLLLNQAFVLFTGMAGKVGLYGMEGDFFRNRYFTFGHGGYFRDSLRGGPDFMDAYWLPLLCSGFGIEPHDDRVQSGLDDLVTLLLNNAEPIKLACYVLPLIFLVIYVNGRRVEAEKNATESKARELAAYAEQSLGVDPERSILLAIEAVRTMLRHNELPLPVAVEALHQAVDYSLIRFSLRGDSQAIEEVEFGGDGKQLITGNQAGAAMVWDTASGREIGKHPYSGKCDQINTAGNRATTSVATLEEASSDTNDRQIQLPLSASAFECVAVSPDHRHLFVRDKAFPAGSDEVHYLLDARNGRKILSIRQSNITGVAFSPDGKRFVTLESWTLRVWDVNTGGLLLSIQEKGLVFANHVKFSPNGRLVATYGFASVARLWNSETGKQAAALNGHSARINGLAFAADGSILATASDDKTVRLWDTDTGEELRTLYGHVGKVRCVAFSADRSYLASGSDDGTTKIWQLFGYELFGVSGVRGGNEASWMFRYPSAVAFSPNGKLLAVARSAAGPAIFDVADPQKSTKLQTNYGEFLALRFSRDGKRLLTAKNDCRIYVWDTHTGQELYRSPDAPGTRGGLGPIFDLAGAAMENAGRSPYTFSPDASRLAVGKRNSVWEPDGNGGYHGHEENVVNVWDVTTGSSLMNLRGNSGQVTSLAYSPDGKSLAAASLDKTAIIWNALGGDALNRMRSQSGGLTSITFSPDGKRIAIGSDTGVIELRDAVSGKQMLQLIGHEKTVTAVAFSPDGKRLATGSADGAVKIWNTASGQELLALGPLLDQIDGLAFSPDGSQLAAADASGTVLVYAMDVRDLLSLARQRVTRDLTRDECRRYLHTETCTVLH